MRTDTNFGWLRNRVWYPAIPSLGIISGTSIAAVGDLLISADTGASDQSEISTSGIVPQLLANNSINKYCLRIPNQCDISKNIGVQLNYAITQSGAVTAIVDFFVSNAVIVPNSAINTTFTNSVRLVDLSAATVTNNVNTWSPRKMINLKQIQTSLTQETIESGVFLNCHLSSSGYVNVTNFYVIGVQLDYVPIRCNMYRSALDRPLGVVMG